MGACNLYIWLCPVQSAAEEARFECARKLTELESRKKYEFLEAMLSSMDAHLRFFERGHEVSQVIHAAPLVAVCP